MCMRDRSQARLRRNLGFADHDVEKDLAMKTGPLAQSLRLMKALLGIDVIVRVPRFCVVMNECHIHCRSYLVVSHPDNVTTASF